MGNPFDLLDPFERWIADTFGPGFEELGHEFHDIWSQIEENPELAFLKEWIPSTYHVLVQLRHRDPVAAIRRGVSLLFTVNLPDFLTQLLFGFSRDEPGKVRKLAGPKLDLVRLNGQYADLIAQEMQALQGMFVGDAATHLDEANSAFHARLKNVTDLLATTPAADEEYAEAFEAALSQLSQNAIAQGVGFLWMGAVVLDSTSAAQLGIDIPEDIVALLVTLAAVIATVAVAWPYLQAASAIETARQAWAQRGGVLVEDPPAVIFRDRDGQPYDPRKGPNFPKWITPVAIAVLILGGFVAVRDIYNMLTPKNQSDLDTLYEELGKEYHISRDDLAALLAAGFTPDEIRTMVRAGLTRAQITSLVARLGIESVKALADDTEHAGYTLPNLLLFLATPGIEQLVQDLTNGSATSLEGALYQLKWIVAHRSEVAALEPSVPGPNGTAERGPDVILKDGTVVQLKSYHWNKYNPFILKREIEALKRDIERDKRNFPGKPIEYIFDSTYGPIPDAVRTALQGAGVTVLSWP